MTATLTPTRDRPTRLPSFFDSPAPAARVYDAVKVYGRGENEVRALDGVTVEFAARRFTAIMGPSGSGKSTLIHSVAGLNTQRAQICRYAPAGERRNGQCACACGMQSGADSQRPGRLDRLHPSGVMCLGSVWTRMLGVVADRSEHTDGR
jgi:energy-coupling factor transporter ATP-binding protein EcfA2